MSLPQEAMASPLQLVPSASFPPSSSEDVRGGGSRLGSFRQRAVSLVLNDPPPSQIDPLLDLPVELLRHSMLVVLLSEALHSAQVPVLELQPVIVAAALELKAPLLTKG